MLQVIYCWCLEFWAQNHPNSKSGNVFELKIRKLEVEQIDKWGEKNPNKTDSLNDNWNERYFIKIEKCSHWDYLAHWETQFFFPFQVLWRGLSGKKKTYSNRWEQKMFLSFYLLSCLAVFSLQPHKHWSFWRDYLHEFTARKLNHKGVKQDPRSPRRPVKGRNQELSRVYNMCFHHINILPIPNFIPSAYANISLLLNWHIKNGKGFCSGTQRMNLLPRCS